MFLCASLPAWAQPSGLSCTVSSGTPPTLRAEGLSELTSDVVITCTGGTPAAAGQTLPLVNVQLFLNVNVTSRILSAGLNLTEALLLIDEPGSLFNPSPQLVCGSSTAPSTSPGICSDVRGTGSGAGVYSGTSGRPNVFLGRLSQSNSLVWSGIPLDAPGPGRTRTLRITNLRANASTLGVSAVPNPVIALVAFSSAASVPLSNPQATVGFVARGLDYSLRGADPAFTISQAPTTLQPTWCGGQPVRIATLRFTEGFAQAFKPRTSAAVSDIYTDLPAVVSRNSPGAVSESESGFVNTSFPNDAVLGNVSSAGVADSGTILSARFSFVGFAGTVYIDPFNNGASGQKAAKLLSVGGSTFAPASVPSNPLLPVSLPLVNGQSGTATWQIVASDAASIQQFEFGVYISPGAQSPSAPTVTIDGTLGPLSNGTTASATAAIPRFASLTSQPPRFVVPGLGTCSSMTSQPASLTFNYPVGSFTTSQSIQMNVQPLILADPPRATAGRAVRISTAAGLPATAFPYAARNWLSATPISGDVPGSFQVSANPSGLPAGSYSGTVLVTAPGTNPVFVPVTMNISGTSSSFTVSPTSLSLTAAVKQRVQANLTTASTGSPMAFAASILPGASWLSVSPVQGTTPNTITVTADAANLILGVYNGTVRIEPLNGSPVNIPVTLTVQPSIIEVSPPSVNLTAGVGQTAEAQATVVSTANTAIFTASATSTPGGWLSVRPSGGTTPGTLTISANTTNLARGTYTGLVTVDVLNGGGAVSIPVTLTVADASLLRVAPASLSFSAKSGDRVALTQALQVTAANSSALAFTVATTTQAGGSWLKAAPVSASTSAGITISANPEGLAAGTYAGSVTLTASGSSTVVPVSLTVAAQQVLAVEPYQTLRYTPGGPTPPPQDLQVASRDGSQVPFVASVRIVTPEGGNWLTAFPSQAVTPATLQLTCDGCPTLPSGEFAAIVTITPVAANKSGNAIVEDPPPSHEVLIKAGSNDDNPLLISPGGLELSADAPRQDVTVETASDTDKVSFISRAGLLAPCTRNGLSASPSNASTNAVVTVAAGADGLQLDQECTGYLAIQASPVPLPLSAVSGSDKNLTAAAAGAVAILKTVKGAALRLSASSLSIDYGQGSPSPAPYTVGVTSSDGGRVSFTSRVAPGTAWLTASGGVTPGTLQVGIRPPTAAGDYVSSIVVTSQSGATATLPVRLRVQSAGTVSGDRRYSLAQIADGGGWQTTVILTNPTETAQVASVKFYRDSSNTFGTASWSPAIVGGAATANISIGPNSSYTLQTARVDPQTTAGWAEVTSTGELNGFAVFRQELPGSRQEAAVPIAAQGSRRFFLPYDNTKGFTTSLALANISDTEQANITVVFRGANGTRTVNLGAIPARGHRAFNLVQLFGVLDGDSGVAEFTTPTGQLSVLGLRFHGATFTSFEAQYPRTAPVARYFSPQIADGGAYQTSITVVNTGNQQATINLNFYRSNSVPGQATLAWNPPLVGNRSTQNVRIDPGTSVTFQTAGVSGTTSAGWAEINASPSTSSLGGFAVFRQLIAGTDQEAAVPINAVAQQTLLLPYDNQGSFTTSLAAVNVSDKEALIKVTVRSASGVVRTADLRLPPRGHGAYTRLDAISSALGNLQGDTGVAEFSSDGGAQLSLLGLRFDGPTFTSFKALPAVP